MSDDIALVLIKRIEALEAQVAELRPAPTLRRGARTITVGDGLPYMTIRFDTLEEVRRANDEINALAAPLEWPAIDLGPVTGTEKA